MNINKLASAIVNASLNFCFQKSNLQYTFTEAFPSSSSLQSKTQKTFCLFYRKTVSQTRQYLGQAERDAARNNRGMGSQRENVFVVGRSLHNNMSRRENNILLQYISLCILPVLGEFKRDEPAYAWSCNRKKNKG